MGPWELKWENRLLITAHGANYQVDLPELPLLRKCQREKLWCRATFRLTNDANPSEKDIIRNNMFRMQWLNTTDRLELDESSRSVLLQLIDNLPEPYEGDRVELRFRVLDADFATYREWWSLKIDLLAIKIEQPAEVPV